MRASTTGALWKPNGGHGRSAKEKVTGHGHAAGQLGRAGSAGTDDGECFIDGHTKCAWMAPACQVFAREMGGLSDGKPGRCRCTCRRKLAAGAIRRRDCGSSLFPSQKSNGEYPVCLSQPYSPHEFLVNFLVPPENVVSLGRTETTLKHAGGRGVGALAQSRNLMSIAWRLRGPWVFDPTPRRHF